MAALPSGLEDDVYPPILLALVLDLAELDGADLAGARDVRAAAGLQVDALDLEQPDAALTGRRLHRHGAHQLRPRRQLVVGDPARPNGMVLDDQPVECLLDRGPVELRTGHVEVEPAAPVADLAAGDVAGDH